MKVVWMYHDIMDLYGDKGNMMVLKKRCLDRGIPFELDTCGIGEEKDLSEYDLIFLGGGADKEQISLIPDLLSRKENIKKAMDEKTFVLLICVDINCLVNIILRRIMKKFLACSSMIITRIRVKLVVVVLEML